MFPARSTLRHFLLVAINLAKKLIIYHKTNE